MKNILKYVVGLTFFLGLFSACGDDYEQMDVKHSFVQTSFGNKAKRIQVNSWFSVHDLSRGEISRKWILPAGTLGENSTAITESTQKNLRLSFPTPGTYTIKLAQVFADNVFVDGLGLTDSKEYEESFDVVVVDSVRAAFKALRDEDDSEIPMVNGAQNEVMAGRIIKFTSISTGEPDTWRWLISRKDGFLREVAGAGGEGSFKFSAPGVYDLTFIASSAFGADTIVYTDIIKIVASTDPVVLDDVKRYSANEIGLVYSRSMQDASSCNPNAFTISVTNGGNTVPVEIKSLSTAENIVKIKLSDNIYNSDIVTVGYNAAIGNLITEDAVVAPSFQDNPLDFHATNILAQANFDVGFENSTAANWPYLWWGAPYNGYTLEISSAMKHSGSKSIMINMKPEGGAIFDYKIAGAKVPFPIKSGVLYELGFWVYMEELGNAATGANLMPDLRFFPSDWSSELMLPFDAAFPVGQWVYKSIPWDNKVTGNVSFLIRGYNASSTANTKFYLDDMILFEKEVRP